MSAEADIRRRAARYVVALLTAALLTGCGSVQIFDSFGEAETEAPVGSEPSP